VIRARLAAILAASMAAFSAPAAEITKDRTYAAVGAPDDPKVPIAWNRFYDVEGINILMRQIAEAHPELARVVTVGESFEGREILALEVTSFGKGDAATKPAMYIDGNIHGNEAQCSEVVVYTAWYLTEQYGRVDRVTKLLDERVFYLLPSINPDGRDHWLADPSNPHLNRGGRIPTDNDGDGLSDEDGPDDIDGDGQITSMRIRDPFGRYIPDPFFPDLLMIEVPADQQGIYRRLGWEGIDNDGDGEINEDGPGGYDPNRNWPWDWQPESVQSGAGAYPFSLPETRAVSQYVLARPNIAGVQSYHNAGGMILAGPGRQGGIENQKDRALMQKLQDRGAQMLPFYRPMITWKDLYTVWGGEFDWFYGGLGIVSFTNELWTMKNLYRRDMAPGDEGGREERRFLRHLLLDEGVTPWREVDHPTLGKVEVGGIAKTFGRVPPSFMLEEELHRNMAFTLFHAEQLPLLRFGESEVEALGEGLVRVRLPLENAGLIPTRTDHDVRNGITPDNIVELTGAEVLAAGVVTDADAGRIEWQRHRPERLRVATVPGNGRVLVELIVRGKGTARAKATAQRGGVATTAVELP
jgi:hypothetical protein